MHCIESSVTSTRLLLVYTTFFGYMLYFTACIIKNKVTLIEQLQIHHTKLKPTKTISLMKPLKKRELFANSFTKKTCYNFIVVNCIEAKKGGSMDKILSKIQKALALAKNNSSAEEAQNAMLLAQKLMLKHNLSFDDVDVHQESKKEIQEVEALRTKVQWWQKILADIIANNFWCYTYTSTYYHRTSLFFVGMKDDARVAAEVFHMANDSIKYFSLLYMKRKEIKRKWKRKYTLKNDYIMGYLSGLNEKFKEQVKVEAMEVLLVKEDVLNEYFEKQDIEVRSIKATNTSGDGSAILEGYIEGKRFDYGRHKIEG